MAGKLHHRTARYQRWAPTLTRAAARNPRAVCAICGRTAGMHPLGANGKPQVWHAAHTIDGSHTWQPWLDNERVPPPGDWLAAALSRCNCSDGAVVGNRQRNPSSGWI